MYIIKNNQTNFICYVFLVSPENGLLLGGYGGMGFMILTVTTDVHILCLGFAMIIPVVIKEAQDETLGD